MANSELPGRENKRGGLGWWMDLEGVWRAPEEWPEDTPPVDGWLRAPDGTWHSPTAAAGTSEERAAVAVAEPVADPKGSAVRSRQANADRRAMLTVAGVVGAAALILVAALILITQASAEDVESEVGGSVIFAAETDQVRQQRRSQAAVAAPDKARELLSTLVTRAGEDAAVEPDRPFDPLDWIAERTDCLDIAEVVLIERSESPIVWADQRDCVPDSGRWTDRYVGATISRTIEADVTLLVPPAIAFRSGGVEWTDATRQAYLSDTGHPATLEVTSAGSGHNPRRQGPEDWKPARQATWCAYAVDWVAVKARWELSVTAAERGALSGMLDTCSASTSNGADPLTMVIDPIAPPVIERIG